MTSVIDLADDFQDLLIQRQNPGSGEALQFEVSAQGILKSLAAQLNTAQEGRYLFSGTKTDVPPIKDEIPPPFTPSIPDDLYYQGNNDDISARVQENFEVQYNVRANDPAFQKLFAAIHLGIDAASSSDSVNLTTATAMVTEAVDELIAVRAKVQQDVVNIGEINERHEQLNLYWKGFSEKIIKTDLLSASTEVAMGEAILQASFSSFSKLNQLRLTDFLR
jgi:flagellar hook-associated protein 3 FlgL